MKPAQHESASEYLIEKYGEAGPSKFDFLKVVGLSGHLSLQVDRSRHLSHFFLATICLDGNQIIYVDRFGNEYSESQLRLKISAPDQKFRQLYEKSIGFGGEDWFDDQPMQGFLFVHSSGYGALNIALHETYFTALDSQIHKSSNVEVRVGFTVEGYRSLSMGSDIRLPLEENGQDHLRISVDEIRVINELGASDELRWDGES